MYQRIRVGQLGPIDLQGEKVGHFLDFVSDFGPIFIFNLKMSNFDPLACKLGDLFIQNSHLMFTYNIPGASSSIFIGFCGIEF